MNAGSPSRGGRPTIAAGPVIRTALSVTALSVTALSVTALMVAALSVLVATSSPADAAGGAVTGGACPDGRGVTVVVDATRLGGGVRVGCASGSPQDGLQALRAAGFEVRGTARFPGFVCRIDGAPASDPCQDTPPADAYWAYWYAPRGGDWSYSDAGATERQPATGSVEGWVFSDGSGAPPSIAPPARPAPPTPVTPAPAGPTGPAVAPPAPGAAVAGITAVPATPAPRPADGSVGPPPSEPVAPAGAGPSAPPMGTPVVPTTTPTDTTAGGATGGPQDGAGDPDATPRSDTVTPGAGRDAGSAPGMEFAVGAGVDEGTGGPLPLLAGLGVVAAVAAAGVVAVRRRRTGSEPQQ